MTAASVSRLPVGRVSGIYGVRGFVRVFSEMEPREAVADFPHIWVRVPGGVWEFREIESGRAHGRGVVLKFVGVDDRELAQAMVGAELEIERSWLPQPESGAYYWADLQGLLVETGSGVTLGQVAGFIQTGANDVLVVRGEREHLVPWVVGRYVLGVDLAARRIQVDWDPDF